MRRPRAAPRRRGLPTQRGELRNAACDAFLRRMSDELLRSPFLLWALYACLVPAERAEGFIHAVLITTLTAHAALGLPGACGPRTKATIQKTMSSRSKVRPQVSRGPRAPSLSLTHCSSKGRLRTGVPPHGSPRKRSLRRAATGSRAALLQTVTRTVGTDPTDTPKRSPLDFPTGHFLDAVPYAWDKPAAARFHEIIAAAYATKAAAELVLAKSGLDTRTINFEQSARDCWKEALDATASAGRARELARNVLADESAHGHHGELGAILGPSPGCRRCRVARMMR